MARESIMQIIQEQNRRIYRITCTAMRKLETVDRSELSQRGRALLTRDMKRCMEAKVRHSSQVTKALKIVRDAYKNQPTGRTSVDIFLKTLMYINIQLEQED
jgi:hypothetical protein